MEDLLQNIIKECSGKQLQNLKQAAQIAYDKLYRQHGMHRDPSHELRSVCFIALKMALDSKRSNLISLGLNGMHRLIRDERFFIGLEPEDDNFWIPAQLLRSTNGITCTSNEETIVNVLRLFLSMACSSNVTLNGRLLIEVLSRCAEYWEYGTRSVKASSLAAGSQCLRTFCNFLKDEADELKRTASSCNNLVATATIYNEVIPVMQWLCSKLIDSGSATATPKKQHSTLFYIESILTLTSTLSSDVHSSPHFTAFLWKTFCPNLAASLGSPGRVNIDKKFSYRDAINIIESENRGFFTRPGLEGAEAKCVYLTAIQLLRIAGAQGSLRPVLEALFHRMLLLPCPSNRAEPLRCVRDAFKNPQRLIDLSVILYYDKNQSCSDDMELFRLIIDSMEECAVSSSSAFGSDESLHASIQCLVSLLTSLQTLCTGDIEDVMSDQVAEFINNRYVELKDADYHGPLTYQSLVRLPRDYRDAVAELKHDFNELSDNEDEKGVQNNQNNSNQESDRISQGSSTTEGPEDDDGDSSDEQSRAEANWLYSNLNEARIDGESDRKHAKEFAKILKTQLVPKLLKLQSSIEIDSEVQEFSSNICHQNCSNISDFDYNLTVINADGIYLATYSTFLLSLQLMRAGHYEQTSGQIPIPLTEQQFVTSIHQSGVLVYLSSAWLRELYQCVLASNPLEAINLANKNSSERCILIDMLNDIGGIGPTQMLSEYVRLQTVSKYINQNEEESPKQKAAKKLARRLLTCCWDSMVVILSAGLGDIEDSRTKKLVKFSKKHLNVRNANRLRNTGETALYGSSLEGLHAAATLSNCLQLQHLSGKILSMIAKNVCQTSGPKLPSTQAMSMELLLTAGLELGSNSEDCWLPILSVSRHVTQLEHDLFSNSSPSVGMPNNSTSKSDNSPSKDKSNPENYFIDEDETCVDVYSFLQAPLQSPSNNISNILKAYPNTVTLSQSDTAKVLCSLSHLADNLFNDAAERLNLPSLCQFIKSLCRASREQLYRNNTNKKGKKKIWWLGGPWKIKNQSLPLSLLLHRVGEITLKVFRSSRPLLHILKVWMLVGPHLMDAACHKDRAISKRAIEYIHDIIIALLVEQSELPHFHYNEALLKPFENIINMQNCDSDVQDQIITCCMEIVEAHRTDIKSAWRSLFATLATKKIHISSVIVDIFRIFLETENTLVFANAGLDCILCLLSYLETSSMNVEEEGNQTASNGSGPASPNNEATATTIKTNGVEFLHDVLKFLENCSLILGCLYKMPNKPNLHSTYKIKGISYTHIVDANVQNSMDNFQYSESDSFQNEDDISYRSLHIDSSMITKLEDIEKSNNCEVLKVWFLLLDGLTNALILCPLSHQSPIIQTIFKIFRSIFENPGLEFGFYCVNHLLIPRLQDWLRYINKTQKNWVSIEKNFKHCCCMLTDLIVEFIEKSQYQSKSVKRKIDVKVNNIHNATVDDDDDDREDEGDYSQIPMAANLSLKQMLIMLVECSVQSQESISRVGVSCIKHILFSIGYLFNEEQWLTICSAIHRATTINLAALRQLSAAFYENSNSFYGDIYTLKVTARRDCTLEEINRIYSLSQQVFQLDSQNQRDGVTNKSSSEIKIINEDRSYAFLLYPNVNNEGNFVLRIPYRNLVIGLLVSQMLLQLIANILFSNIQIVPSELHSVIYEYNSTAATTATANTNTTSNDNKKPRFNLSYRAKEILYRCLRQYFTCSLEFDYRPGLKFLIQKVSNLDYAANLYKQCTSSFIIIFMSLVDVYLSDIEKLKLSSNDLRYIIDSCADDGNGLIKKKEFFVRNLFLLRDIWSQVSELYLKTAKISPIVKQREILINEINIVENKMVEIQEQLENEFHNYDNDTDDDVFLLSQPSTANSFDYNYNSSNNSNKIGKTSSEESLKMFTKDQQQEELNYNSNVSINNNSNPFISSPSSPTQQRENPFNKTQNKEQQQQQQVVSPEIEQQRKLSILKDEQCKRKSLAQLVVASMELLKLLPNESSENVRLLFANTRIVEAFELVEAQEKSLENLK